MPLRKEVRFENLTQKAIECFWSKVVKTEECWVWNGSKTRKYGQLALVIKGERRSVRAHRLSWFLHFGEIPDGMVVCHRCDNPECVNPSHLFIGTQLENINDRHNKGRTVGPKRGELNHSSKLTQKDVNEIRAHKKAGKYTYQQLADIYGISRRLAIKIVKNQAWKEVV